MQEEKGKTKSDKGRGKRTVTSTGKAEADRGHRKAVEGAFVAETAPGDTG